MTGIWVDTDFGFDDLWALLLLRHLGCPVAGVSLVAGNAPLTQVATNADAARSTYGFDWPVWTGAAKPLQRSPVTAERILGPTGMRSRGEHLQGGRADAIPAGALDGMRMWLQSGTGPALELLALGPLTNIAQLVRGSPELATRITRLVWMGGSAGAGNHTSWAEFNAVADPEALAIVLATGISIDIVDLTFCRTVAFGPDDLPYTDKLTGDLLGGYLDIALDRGRSSMAIYDPLAALALARPECIEFSPCAVSVSTDPGETYGATQVSMTDMGTTRLATKATCDAKGLTLDVLQGEPALG